MMWYQYPVHTENFAF